MRIISTVADLRRLLAHEKSQGSRIGLVPTMGNLHAGHLSLVTAALQHSEYVVCSLFLNPLQFGPGEDLDAYPRTPETDMQLLKDAGCHCLFVPPVAEMYPGGTSQQSLVTVPKLGDEYCGKSRPGHFNGVATVVSKLFNMVQPDIAVFGLKDYQQFLVINKLVTDLQFPVRIVGVETVREASGLAMSSRNNYLTAEEKIQASALNRCLVFVTDGLRAGRTDFSTLEQQAREMLCERGLRPDYLAICHARTLESASTSDKELVVLAAAYLGQTRLIDNLRVTL
jgi:pantoate--beta-alanine ligase